ncbi:MAG: flavodoxin family protein [Thermoproteota archaeon]
MVGIVASPRKGMNTNTLVTKVREGAQSGGGAAVEKIYLNDLEIKPCQACSKSPAPEFCLYKDGMEKIYRALETADIMVVETPAYYDSISAQLKLVIDRSNCLVEMITLPDGKVGFRPRIAKKKKGIFIWVSDFSRNVDLALRMIRLWFKDANIELAEVFTVMDADRGEGARNRVELLHKAFELGVLSVEASGKTNTNHAL